MELANNIDSGIHSSDVENNSFNESKLLVKLHDPISLPSQLVVLDLETIPKEGHEATSSRLPDLKCRNETLSGLPDFKYINDGVLINQHLATSVMYQRIMELLRCQKCKDPLKELGLV